MIATKVYSELLETLYAAAMDEAQWQGFLSQLCEVTESLAGFFLLNDSTLGNRALAYAGLHDQAAEQAYREGYSYTDPVRQGFMRNPRVGVIEVEDIVPRQELVQSEIYRLMMRPSGIEYGTCIVPSISPRRYELISLWRTGERPFLEPERKDLLNMLFPHLQNVLKIRKTLARAEERSRTAEAMLDASSTACILLDGDGQVLFMNSAAQTLALAADGIRVRDDRILPADPSTRRAFNALVAAAAADLGNPGGALSLSRSSRKRPLQLLVTPFRLGTAHRSSARVLLLASDPDRPVAFPDVVLRQLYGLTGAETEIANGLLTGFSLDEIATLRRVSVATIRSQMKALLGKTATHRQADLIRLLSMLPRTAPGNQHNSSSYPI